MILIVPAAMLCFEENLDMLIYHRSINMSDYCHESVTTNCHTLLTACRSREQRDFLTRAMKINSELHIPFSRMHYSDFTPANYRKMVSRLRKLGVVELVFRSKVGFYKVKGVNFITDRKFVTYEGKGVGLNMIPLLQMIRIQPPSIHDIKLKFNSSHLHERLKDSLPVNPANQGILVKISLGQYIEAKIMVYPNVVQVDLGCTIKPFVYDIGSALELMMHMGSLRMYLLYLASFQADIPLPGNWIVTHYHFGKDGMETYTGKTFEHKFEDVTGGLIRYYSKTMPSGKMMPRLETICTPQVALNEQIDRMIQEEYAAEDALNRY